ncbi:MAG: hypothetical protein SGCHY_003423, partial [Lobulomycetales sp.]
YTDRRFAHLSEKERELFSKYFASITLQKGSGEYSVSKLLLPGAWARFPLHDRLPRLGIPVSFLYGSTDWMDYRAAQKAALGMSVDTRVVVVDEAGHHLYSDNPEAFNRAFVAEVLSSDKIVHQHVRYV